MPGRSKPLPVVLPARMSLTENAFDDLEIAVFDFPFQDAIDRFTHQLKGLLNKKRLEWWKYPPYRLLNHAIVACSPTVVHGFEKYGSKKDPIRRMLAIGKIIRDDRGQVIGSSLQYPSEQQITELILIWVQIWGQQKWLKKIITGKGKMIWDELLTGLEDKPQTQWYKISPTTFLNDLYAEKGLAFNAVPSLLSTLLHDKTFTIADREVKWRKAQNSSNRLCVVSQPLPISFMRKSGFKESAEEGFFSYKLEFQVQTQAGRDKPWIYAFLHCQRYAEKKLTHNQRWNDITILLGMNRQRMDGWEIDSTLVRLKAKRSITQGDWLEQLPVLLEEFGARSLVSPVEIYANPQNFWKNKNLDDEYYVIHTEGYKYGRSTHKVQTGFGLAEQSEVIDRTCCDLLQGVLEPDRPFEPDRSLKSLPPALWTFENLSESPPLMNAQKAKKQGLTNEQRYEVRDRETHQKRRQQQCIPAKAVERVLRGKSLTILIIYQEQDTCDAIYQQLRETFLLNEEDSFPDRITIIRKPILDLQLCQHLDVGDLNPAFRYKSPSSRPDGFDDQWHKAIQKGHREKRDAWRGFLQTIKIEEKIIQDSCCVAFIERSEEPTSREEFHEDQGIKKSIREACDREGILSQMIRGVQWKTDEETKDKERILRPADKGRTHNAVQDLIIRQLGVLYDPPNTIYQQIGIPEQQARELDVVAFALIKKQIGVTYALAVRLRASGEVDVLLPEKTEWMPYPEAGYKLGQIFADARPYFNNGKMRNESPVSLKSNTLVKFVEDTLIQKLERPTIAIIEAENWRNQGAWEQLKNDRLSQALDRLELREVYKRDDSELNNLLAVVRLRTGDETPQYITNRETWQKDGDRLSRDLYELSGFVERSDNEVFHYFSIGRLPSTIKGYQHIKGREDPYKIEDAGGVPFKHSQAIEMLPFFVRPDFQTEENLKTLCRVPHYLRFSPAWTMGNIVLPYPMHLGEQLIQDRLCILGVTE
ncbi:RNaseH domain-containing protein [Roseofilum sp. BLCC_M91]|uniref:RNaseH domain-containing protein n=1 Tax=Roseofilum halophilum BLCC-M91 TaxID=3022259 RepID=A0ABT7BDK5_9CYAN|nr:RNaseH domain-containing protein [Roseofilum halophilum]MDJ1177251.1 RNaseH domain-containing protein [Roseofilum halophilum BLCC-M91]